MGDVNLFMNCVLRSAQCSIRHQKRPTETERNSHRRFFESALFRMIFFIERFFYQFDGEYLRHFYHHFFFHKRGLFLNKKKRFSKKAKVEQVEMPSAPKQNE